MVKQKSKIISFPKLMLIYGKETGSRKQTHYLGQQAKADSQAYWYYKYCEEEWDLFDTFKTVSADMKKYIDENNNIFTNPETYVYTEMFDKHCDEIIKHCKKALVRFRKAINKNHSDILLTFNIREYLDNGASVCLNAGEYLQEIFDTRADEGFEGSGYDWESLAQVFLNEKCSDLQGKINFYPEADMFCAYSNGKESLSDFILRFKKACEDKPLILDLFSRAELD